MKVSQIKYKPYKANKNSKILKIKDSWSIWEKQLI